MAATYTTTADVKIEAGFQYNTDIADTSVDSKRTAAYSVINTKVAMRYALPLSNNTGRVGSPAEELIKQIELLYAAGLLLEAEYGVEGIDSDKEGNRKKKEALALLNQIMKGEILLLDENGKELDNNDNLGIAPSGRVSISGGVTNSDSRKFTTTQEF